MTEKTLATITEIAEKGNYLAGKIKQLKHAINMLENHNGKVVISICTNDAFIKTAELVEQDLVAPAILYILTEQLAVLQSEFENLNFFIAL